jgi:hypothetical protein
MVQQQVFLDLGLLEQKEYGFQANRRCKNRGYGEGNLKENQGNGRPAHDV